MSLDILRGRDKETTNGILAAAALASTPDPGVGESPVVLREYAAEADTLLSEVRVRLNLADDDRSAAANTAIDNFLAKELVVSIFKGVDTAKVLARVGQAGQLPPQSYNVIQPQIFRRTFSGLGVSASNVEDAIRLPTDYQHLMTDLAPERDRNTPSLFVKRVKSKVAYRNHWLLVQTHRFGLDQIAQSAWRVYPDEVDLSQAAEPIDVLKAFVNVYGSPIRVGDVEALFVDPQSFPLDSKIRVDWSKVREDDWFVSFSQIANADAKLLTVGLAYCIRIPLYRETLKRHGA